MAVAGCINAYDCSGNLIRTLEQLQSSNIGVGVQYTAPNPLDDKKIDYIKYTDKCGCSCTLTGENEILIYATNGVIKNLSLTNDDTNEKVIVKWNDIFGSNWLKTVVRYKTGSAPVSPTDGTLAVEETTKNQYSTTGYGVSGLSDNTTYYFSVFAIDSDGTMIDMQTNSITTNFVFAGYQRVEYIQSSGTQYINTGISANQYLSFETEFTALGTVSDSPLFGSRTGSTTGRFGLIVYNSSFLMLIGNQDAFYGTPVDTNKHALSVFYNSSNFLATIDGNTSTVALSTSALVNQNFWIFNYNYGIVAPCPMKLYSFKLYTGSSTLVRDFYPVYRKSDNVIGLLDIVNKVFYTNSGSGSFTKGPNVN